ncbi:MAG: hypothetical protein WCK41_00850 [Actinomycetes bacterium]
MSLWTPGGEVPVERNKAPQSPTAAGTPGHDAASGNPAGGPTTPVISEAALEEAAKAAGIDLAELSADERAQLEAMMLEMAEVQAQLASAPASQVIANHLGGFFELARIHLTQTPPNFAEASLAIDAMGAVLDAVESRLGPDGPALRQGLDQLRMVFIQVRNESDLDDGNDD